jgi:hypothetical protein
MSPWWLALLPAVLAVLAGLAGCQARRCRQRRYLEAIRAWQQAPPEQRLERLRELATGPEIHPPAWFLSGCALLRECRAREAARAFGIAYHGDCNLESAALLTFAALKAADGPACDIARQIVLTWKEMDRPPLPRTRADRLLVGCLADSTRRPPPLSPIGHFIWSVVAGDRPGPIEQVLADRPEWADALLPGPTPALTARPGPRSSPTSPSP